MKRRIPMDAPLPLNGHGLSDRTAFHEAGHAAAIYLLNKLKQLPPVFFQINIRATGLKGPSGETYNAHVEDGRLIQSLPCDISPSTDKAKGLFSAFEADVVNLLTGPLAEARYVSQSFGHPLSPNLLNPDTLRFFGGTAELQSVNEYLECFIPGEPGRTRKLNELLRQAFDFINRHQNWQAVSALANHILNNNKPVISCEEAISVMDAA